MPFLILFGLRFKAAVLSDVSTNAAAAADVLLNTFHAINHRLVSPAIYQQLLPRLGREMANISGVRPNRYLPHSTGVNISGVNILVENISGVNIRSQYTRDQYMRQQVPLDWGKYIWGKHTS